MRVNTYFKHCSEYVWVILFLSILCFLPTLVHADSTGIALSDSSSSALFTPSPNDQSIIYMGELFGSIPPVLAGTGSSLLGNLFKIFNTAVMALGIIIAGYTTFVGILNTAGEGEMLGKGWSSIWVPIKTVAGIALLIPTASGYCVVQIFMMWLLVQGIGAADSLTNGVIDYMQSGQKVYVAGNTPNYDGNTNKVTDWDATIQNVYEGLSCMQGLQKNYPLVNPAYVTPPAPTANGNAIEYRFVANKYYSTTPNPDGSYTPTSVSCGTISFDNTSDDQKAMNAYLTQGLTAIMPSLNAAAFFMVNDVPVITPPNTTAKQQAMQDTFNFVGSDFMNQVATTYNSYVIQANNSLATPNSDDLLDSIRSYGWISLGNLYWKMAQSGSDDKGSDGKAAGTAHLTWVAAEQNISSSTYSSTFSDYVTEGNLSVYEYGYTYGEQFIADLMASRNQDNAEGNTGVFKTAKKVNYSNAANGIMSAMSLDVLNQMQSSLSSSATNPMIAAQRLGHKLMYNVEALMTTFVAVETAVGAIAFGLSVDPFTFAYGIILMLLAQFIIFLTAPFLFVLYGVLMTLGSILAVIIPFIPALVFFLAAIAWMVATLETIVAAPIVAIGLIHPDGQHPVFGKAEPAIMLMINMFLRPSLMVIGMAAGVLLSFISVQFVNFGFSQVIASVLGNIGSGDMGVTWAEATLFLTTYVGLILACVNKSFSVIDALPDTVMRWIHGGEGTRFGGGQEAMNKLQGSQESAGQKASGDTMSSGQEAGQASSKAGEQADKADQRLETGKRRDADGNKASYLSGGKGGSK